MARDLSDLDAAALMLDGIVVAGPCCVAALAITAEGRKVPIGLWLGDTENRTVVTDLLADLVQRCTLHKRRSVAAYLPKELAGRVDRRLRPPRHRGRPTRARAIATELEADHPDAAASLREGLTEMFTVRRLGVEGRLARTLTSTSPIESMISVARTTMANVKRWRDGTMKKRWLAAGVLEAQRSFRRVKGCGAMPVLVAALRPHAAATTSREDAA